jgi:hypothetical protein
MRFITEAAMRSAEAVALNLERTRGNFAEGEQAATLNHLQNIVVMAAALSRYFWPVRPAHYDRGALLRSDFQITNESPLKSRDLRNEIEHFDEKLDVYFSQPVVGVIIPQYIGPYVDKTGVPGHLFRAYYTDRGIFEVLGKQFSIVALVEEIQRVDARLDKSH